MIARGQSKKAQQARLALGCCPVHGIALGQTGVCREGDYVECPRRDCVFVALARRNSKLWRALHVVTS